MQDYRNFIVISGARENNLKNVSLDIPKNTLTVFSGLSGSGKSTLAFDTIYAEGQRRYVESLSPYARQFLGGVDKPDVDSIEGLSPAISIDQKTTSHNPRSTVGTVTEIYDYLRLLFARTGVPYCPNHHIPIVSFSPTAMVNEIKKLGNGTKLQLLAPVVSHEKGTHKDTLEKLSSKGFSRVRVDGIHYRIEEVPPLEKNKRHDIDLVVDRIVLKDDVDSRLFESIETALDYGFGHLVVLTEEGEKLYSSKHTCPECGFSIPSLEPRLFSFNAPLGYCPKCKGLGITREVAEDLLVPNMDLSINEGAIRFYKGIVGTANIEWQEFCHMMDHYGIPYDKPWKELTPQQRGYIIYGSDVEFDYKITTQSGNTMRKKGRFEGLKNRIERLYRDTNSEWNRWYYGTFMRDSECTECHGARLNGAALSVRVNGLNIHEVTCLSIDKLLAYLKETRAKLDPVRLEIASMVLTEIENRAKFLSDVGLGYLTLSRMAMTLSGGEAQRIRLATQIGSRLSGVLYVLDEPSIGLHQKDNRQLIKTMQEMRDLGNTLIVVEHDEETIRSADYVVDIGPGAGEEGGSIVCAGTPEDIANCKESITGAYLSGKMKIEVPKKRRKGNGRSLVLKGCKCHNLKNINVSFPLGCFIAVTGVSGSGKSSLVNETLYKAIYKHFGKDSDVLPGEHASLEGLEYIDRAINVSQEPIGRTPRSNPATYTKLFDDIRELFAQTPVARERGYDKGRFSFNVVGGRCEKCQGAGVIAVPMNFLPDVYVKCDECDGHRYNAETLACTYKGKNIYDVLEMRVEEALHFFESRPAIYRRIKTLYDVGLGYIKLGQSATTLSGGEAQRVKLAYELQRRPTGKTVYILDEPTTGLHSDDVKRLIGVLQSLVDHGDTVILIEHNLDVVKVADHVIDIGPDGGDKGGRIVAKGTPEEVAKNKNSYTGMYLKELL